MGTGKPALIRDSFDADALNPWWRPLEVGSGRLEQVDGTLRCVLGPASSHQYSDAQISDYQGLARRDFPWRAPLRLRVRAWASHPVDQLKGTAGFGFWNAPFVPVGTRLPALPRAVWFFFASPPNNMALAKGVPGYGWKAATIDAWRPGFLALAPFAPIGFLLMRVPALVRRLWPIGQRALGVAEAPLPVDISEPHNYELTWRAKSVTFRVDEETVLVTPYAPRGPLGFVAWNDNQYAIVTPQGRFGYGLIDTTEEQTLALDEIEIQPL